MAYQPAANITSAWPMTKREWWENILLHADVYPFEMVIDAMASIAHEDAANTYPNGGEDY